MNTFRQLFLGASVATLAIALSPAAAMTADGSSELTRAEVKAAVMDARRAGMLRPAGEASEPMGYAGTTIGSTGPTRAEVRAEVRTARMQHALIPAGEGVAPSIETFSSTLARADVKRDVLQARRDGELIPAGEGVGPVQRVAKAASHDAMKVASRR